MARHHNFFVSVPETKLDDLTDAVRHYVVISQAIYGGGYTRRQNVREAFSKLRWATERGFSLDLAVSHLLTVTQRLDETYP